MSFREKYSKILDTVQEEINQVSAGLTCGVDIQDPLKSKLFELLNAPSKHIRPLISFLYLKSRGLNIDEKQIMLQTVIELVHNASLIHDDVIDESNIRRNTQTLNSKFGNKLAVISGDYLLSSALHRLGKLNSIHLIEMFSDTLACMANGEIKQQFDKYKIPSIEKYIEKTIQKTAKLFETSVKGSLFLAGSSENGTEFARNFGIAFQIRDDLINIQTTKTDLNAGIYIAPVHYADGRENYTDGIEKTRSLLNNYIDNAFHAINHIEDNKYKTAITELLGLIRNE